MLDTLPDITAEQVAWQVRRHWGIEPAETTYAALGAGSYNWIIRATDDTKWFIKVDPMASADFFRETYRTAAIVRDNGLDFVHAAVRDRTGQLRRALSPDWEIAVFAFIEGRNPDFHDAAERAQIAEAVGRLHAFEPLPDMAMRWEPGYRQAELRELLARDLDQPWEQGPYGQRAKALIVEHMAGIEMLQAWHDKLYERFQASNDPWVITHGEPHDGNTMLDTEGAIHLIDCNASLLAPRERDLRLLLHVGHQQALDVDNTEVIAAYQRGAGQPIEARPCVLDLFRAEWHLMEISGYACSFRDEHDDTDGAAGHWKALSQYLPVEQNWPNLM